MNVWSGAFALNSESQLRGLQLIDRSSSWQSDIPKDSPLSLRSFVNPALIPLYARVGPNLELYTTEIETSQWLKSKLLGAVWLEEEDLDRFQTIQCPVGLLVSVNSAARAKLTGSTTTDLLVHGVLSGTTSFERPPTPPVSSSPSSDEPTSHAVKQELRIYATPLCASLITKARALPSPANADGLSGDGQPAEFLPDIRSPSPKRKRVATLFETVAQNHRRVRQKGGETVSQSLTPSLFQSSQQLKALRVKQEPEEPGVPALDRITSQRSRSLSVGTNLLPGKSLELRTENTRPTSSRSYKREMVSRRGTPNPFTDTIARNEKESSPALLSSEGRLGPPSSTPKDAESIIFDNKNTITRTILTCMRLYGFNRTSARSGSSGKNHVGEMDPSAPTDGIPLASATSNTDDDEFKAMYHATYRASTFALRKYLKQSPGGEGCLPPSLDKAKAMTYIDEFLRLFCEEN